MAYDFLDLATTPGVLAAQAANGAAGLYAGADRPSDRFGEAEAEFIAQRDSFYMASVSQTGGPYVQHRGGPPGFIKVLDDRTLAFPDFRGNRQYISLGNISADGRVALILMDYLRRQRLKIFARAEPRGLADDPDLAAQLALPGYRGRPERAMLLHLEAFDWNCQQHIVPRLTAGEAAVVTETLTLRVSALEAENAALRTALAGREGATP